MTGERLPRYDKMVTLPKPFIFSLSGAETDEGACSVVFYDNAGEHFQPGQDSANSPGAQHIAASDAIFFLFDPTINPDFRACITGADDPQLSSHVSDQQDVILAETEVRMKKLLAAADKRLQQAHEQLTLRDATIKSLQEGLEAAAKQR